MKQEMWWKQPLMKVWVIILYIKNDMHAPAALQKLAIGCLVIQLLKFRARFI